MGPAAVLTREQARIVIVDDHPVVHDGVAAQLQRYSDMVVVGRAGTGAAAIAVCAEERPDVVLLDLRLPDCLAADVVPQVHRVSPDSRILLFTAFPEYAAVTSTLAAGACGEDRNMGDLVISDTCQPEQRWPLAVSENRNLGLDKITVEGDDAALAVGGQRGSQLVQPNRCGRRRLDAVLGVPGQRGSQPLVVEREGT